MTFTSWPFENRDTSETEYGYLFRELHMPGVSGSPGSTALRVTPGPSGLSVTVSPGRAMANGFVFACTAEETVTLSPAGAARTDRIVVRFDPAANAATLEVVEGSSTDAPALTQTDTGIWEISLARVSLPAGATAVSAAWITDERVWLGNVWTTSTRPGTSANPVEPIRGRTLGFNLSTNAWEFFGASGWENLIPAAPTWATLAGKPTTSTLDGMQITVSDSAPGASTPGKFKDIWLEF